MAETYKCMIKVIKHFSYNQNFVPRGLTALATGLYTCIKLCYFLILMFSLKPLEQFSSGFLLGFAKLFKWFRTIGQDGHHAYIW